MPKKNVLLFIGIYFLFTSKSLSQFEQTVIDFGRFLDDATLYSKKYITPMTDAAVYQSSSNWMTSPKKRKLWDVTLGIHGNVFFVPKPDRSFEINNSDFSFFSIQDSNGQVVNSAVVPTSLGGQANNYLVGFIDGNEVEVEAPNGVDDETIMYPYVQGSVGLWYGFEVAAKFSSKVKLKHGDYQVYGFGVKHNFSQYSNFFEKKKINLAGLICFSNEKVGFDFLSTQTSLGNIGLNRISGLVNTWQMQFSGSKEWNRFELMFSTIANTSKFEYKLSGEKGLVETILPIQEIMNDRLSQINENSVNLIAEISGRYQFSNFFIQSSFALGKFVNANVSVQYEF